MNITVVLLTVIGLAAGYAIAYFMAKTKQSRLEERNRNLEEQLHSLRLEMDEEESESSRKLENERQRAQDAEKQLAELSADYRNLKERLTEQKQELQKMEEKFRTEFKNLANEILDEKSKKFTEQNRENMDRLLNPLGEKLEEFKKKVEETYSNEARERNTLKGEITKIFELNQKITEETKNLTRALKGDSKQQGNWGEVILQRILEKSGLSKDREYFIQESHTTDEGRRLQPDVVVKLPDGKHLIIDSKVSLTAYEKFSSADEKPDQERALKQHITSMRAHVRGLSDKKYHQIYDFQSPDFILMFIPIEPAFGLAMQNAPDLYNEAFEKNIIIVSPTTLLATLATIENVWKQEYQNKNAMEIASRGGALYDKFVLFAESMNKVGDRIRQTQDSYDEAMTRLSTGSGNVIRQVEMLRELGAKTSKQIPENLKEDKYRLSDNESGNME